MRGARLVEALDRFVLGGRAGRDRSPTTRLVTAVAGPLALGYLSYRVFSILSNAGGLVRLRPGRDSTGEAAGSAAGATAPGLRVSLLVPARDEEDTLVTTLPALLAQGADDVVVLDDHSTDATARVARDAGARVISGANLPEGWVGKPWACHQLAAAVLGEDAVDGDAAGAAGAAGAAAGATPREHLLIFTDADVTWHPGALAALVAEMQRRGTDLLTVFPKQRVGSFGERLVVPLVDAAFIGHAPVPVIRSRRRGAVAANGQVMAFRRQAYERAGGHAAVRGELVEDIRLARAARDAGARFDAVLGARRSGCGCTRPTAPPSRGWPRACRACTWSRGW
ncbi:glycosyltransferase [Serinibacter arcticus]|uniref:glycosyltransferase n=1 Tax=Serinibacter arcticus TaxID=1655435 RepID=UPI0018EE618D|nr:glycosyltransferase family 2 protein [Serinibacter arcticus]